MPRKTFQKYKAVILGSQLNFEERFQMILNKAHKGISYPVFSLNEKRYAPIAKICPENTFFLKE